MIILNTGTEIFDNNQNVYVLGDIIGSGGFGYVFKAIRKSDNKTFAVKTMLPSFGNNDDQLVFENEIALATKIVGENIIHYEFVNDGKILPNYPPYIIMEYANHGTLKELIRSRNKELFSNQQIISMFKQLVNGMNIINKTFVHRDIKPDNILICDSTLKITDFGLSKIAAESTRTNSFKGWGTYLYMSPEAWILAPNKMQMDIYSMGIVFFQIASLQYPYNSEMSTVEECKRVHLYGAIKNLSQLNPNLSSTIISVINKMLEKADQNRFKNWSEILAFLEKNEDQKKLSSIVSSLIEIKSAADVRKQKEIEAFQKQKQEENEFYNLVKSQFENEIWDTIIKVANEYNDSCASNDKFTSLRVSPANEPKYYYEFRTPFKERIVLGLWVVYENSLQKKQFNYGAFIDKNREDIYGRQTQMVNYTLTHNNKPVIGLAKIFSEETRLGFNLILLKSGGLYGDWVIMRNKNNFSAITGNMRQEPFAFDFDELPREIDNQHTTGNYSYTTETYTKEKFMQILFSIFKKS